MKPVFIPLRFLPFLRLIVGLGTAGAVLLTVGCSSVAPSPAVKTAGTGAAIGGITGAVVGNNTSMGTTTGVLGGVAAGAIVGGIVGMVQDAKERKEQDNLAQQRAYQQDLAKRRTEESRRKLANEEELAVAQGFRISEMELADAQRKADDANNRLKRLEDERNSAKNRTKALIEAQERLLSTEAKIAEMEEELARLKGETAADTASSTSTATGQPKPGT